MQDTWISQRRTLPLPGLTLDHHVSAPSELECLGCNHHLLCLLLSDGNRQNITRIGQLESTRSQNKGDFWIYPALHTGLWDWESTDESLMFFIDPDLLVQTAAEMGESQTQPVELIATVSASDPKMLAIARLFLAEMDHEGTTPQLYTESLIQIFTIHLLQQYCAFPLRHPQITSGLSRLQLQEVLDYIDHCLDRSLHLAELAGVLGLSQYHFSRLFKQSTGTAPYQYVLQQRMERASKLLRQRKYTVAEIALLVGYADQSRFTKHFKRYFGITPKRFLEQIR